MNSKIGETRKMHCGLMATIITWRTSTDLDIKFEDGIIVCHKRYSNFRSGGVGHPSESRNEKLKEMRVGEKRTMKNGLVAEIIAYRTSNDIDILFEDGYIRENVSYQNYKKGIMKHPNANAVRQSCVKAKERVGERFLQNSGEWITITEYFNSHNATVKWDDGTIRENVYYGDIRKGLVRKDVRSAKHTKEKITGLTIHQSCGMDLTCTEYDNGKATLVFEDGTVLRGKQIVLFRKGIQYHPDLPSGKQRNKSCYHGFIVQREAFVMNDGRTYYYCTSPEGETMVLTPQKMRSWKKEKNC